MRVTASLIVCLVTLVIGVLSSAEKSSVLDLTKMADFEANVGKSVGAFVDFYAPWCGHCKKLAPKFEELGDVFASRKDSVIIGKVDADNNRDLGQKFGVRGFPTLMYFKPNSLEPETYSGPRDVASMQKFVEEQSGKKAQIKPQAPPKAIQLDAASFDKVVMDSAKNVFVEYYAPWCGFCKKVAPVIERVAAAYENEEDCVVAQMNADDAANRAFLASRQIEVQAYPTFKFYSKSSKDAPEPFDQLPDPAETEAKLIDYINARCMTHRVVGGGLSDLAGRMPLLDSLASKFFMAAGKDDERNSVLTETRSYVERMSTSVNATASKNAAAAYYVKVMDKTVGEPKYLEKETKRLASLLKKHLDGTSTLATKKYDDLKRRANILASFAKREMSQKAREAADQAVKGVVGGNKDEL
jgi:protein disulfide-isomerase A6